MKEVGFLLNVNSSGVLVCDDEYAAMEKIREWILTPQGDIHGMPAWGNQFFLFRHLPSDSMLEVQIELHIVTKLPRIN